MNRPLEPFPVHISNLGDKMTRKRDPLISTETECQHIRHYLTSEPKCTQSKELIIKTVLKQAHIDNSKEGSNPADSDIFYLISSI
jgi:hypothetical protein